MSQKFVLAGVGSIQLFDPSTGELIVTSKTLTESGIGFNVTMEEIRGGLANQLVSMYAHDSGMTLSLTDCLYSMQYLALNVGGTINVGANVMTQEQVVTSVANAITVSSTPKDFSTLGTIGWYKISTASDDTYAKITFDATTKTASVADLPAGTTVCVKYMKEDASAEQFTVSSAFIPSQCYALLTLPLFKAGTEKATSYTSSSKVGEVQIEIPNFLLAGTQDLSLTASGAATTSLSGSALATYDGSEGCTGDGYYARLKQVTYGKDEFADVKSIVIYDSDIELEVPEKQILEVYAIYGGVTAPRKIDNSKITFTMETGKTGVATVDATGEITSVGAGQAYIEAMVTGHTNLVAMGVITVTEP